MITKQQTLEFIDELSNQTNVYINLERGKMYADVYVDYEEGITGTYTADIGFKPQSYELPLLGFKSSSSVGVLFSVELTLSEGVICV